MLSCYTSSKVDYSIGETIYMLPSDMNLHIKTGTAGYNNKILVSDSKFSLDKNDKVNALVLEPVIPKESMPSHKVIAHAHKDSNKVLAQKPTTTHKEEKIALILCLTGAFMMWYMLQ